MATTLFSDTLIQNTGETDADFNTRVLNYIQQQQYYFEQVGGSFPAKNGIDSIGSPPREPFSDTTFWDVTAGQNKRVVTFYYDNTYYYKYTGTVPPLPPFPPAPPTSNIVVWGPGGTLSDGLINADTVNLNFTNLLPATAAGNAVEYSQFQPLVLATPLTGLLPGVATPITATDTILNAFENLQAQISAIPVGGITSVNADTGPAVTLTVSNVGTAGTLQWSGTDLQIPEAASTKTGLLTATDWSTFNNKQAALSFGNLSESTSSVLTITGGTGAVIGSGTTIQVKQSSALQSGFLSSTDWSTFNNKQAAGSYITALTGDVSATGPGSVSSTVAWANGYTTYDARYLLITNNLSDLGNAATARSNMGTIFTTRAQITSPASPSNATTYYGGSSTPATSTTSSFYKVYVPFARTLVGFVIEATNTTTTATSEASTVFIRKNDTTNTNLSTAVAFNGAPPVFNSYYGSSLSVSFAAGDYYCLGLTTPTWVTRPTAIQIQITLFWI